MGGTTAHKDWVGSDVDQDSGRFGVALRETKEGGGKFGFLRTISRGEGGRRKKNKYHFFSLPVLFDAFSSPVKFVSYLSPLLSPLLSSPLLSSPSSLKCVLSSKPA